MCAHIFLGSDIEVPTSKWSEQDARFHVEPIDERMRSVTRHFSKSHVYYLASHEGCGCGFEWDAREQMAELEQWVKEWEALSEELRKEINWSPSDERRDYEARKKVANDLAILLKHLLQKTGELEIGVFMHGDLESGPTSMRSVVPDELAQGRPDVFPAEGVFYRVMREKA